MANVYAWLSGGSAGSTNPVYKTTDGSTWSSFRGDDGSNTGISYFWIDEFNTFQTAVEGTGASPWFYYTTNNGGTWTSFGSVPPVANFVGILPDGTLLGFGGSSGAQAVTRSTNGGSSWSSASTLPSQSSSMSLSPTFIRTSNGDLFVFGIDTSAGTTQVWSSSNSGSTWSRVFSDANRSHAATCNLSYQKTSTNDVLLLVVSGNSFTLSPGIFMWRSTDFGSTWSNVFSDTAQHGSQNAPSLMVGDPNNPGICSDGSWLVMGCYANDSFNDTTGLGWRSTNDGSTWSSDNSSVVPYTATAAGNNPNLGAWGDTVSVTWGISRGNSITNAVYRSTDGGSTWSHYTTSPFNTSTYSIQRLWSDSF